MYRKPDDSLSTAHHFKPPVWEKDGKYEDFVRDVKIWSDSMGEDRMKDKQKIATMLRTSFVEKSEQFRKRLYKWYQDALE